MAGGPSGEVSWPTYMETFHSELLDDLGVDTPTQSLIETLNTALAATPYTDASRPSAAEAYDPDTELALISTEQGELDTIADGISPETDWEAYVDTVQAKVDEAAIFPDIDIIDSLATELAAAIAAANALIDSANITSQVTAYENSKMNRFMRSVGRFAAGMAHVNAVNHSSFVTGLAML